MLNIFITRKCKVILILLVILVGCTQQGLPTNQVVGSKSPQPLPLEQGTKPEFTQGTPTQINTPVNVGPTPTRLFTNTGEPTRDIQGQMIHILDLIRTNANCMFPCFLGITPGKSTWEMARKFILSTGAKYSDRTESDGIHHFTGYDTKELQIPLDIELVEINGVIEYIAGGIGDLGNKSTTNIDWTPYKISTVLSTYGVPSRILIDIYKPVDPSPTTAYELWMIYDEAGFMISYGGENVIIEDPLRICPNSSDVGDIFGLVGYFKSATMRWPKTVVERMSQLKDLGKVTSLTMGEFYNTYSQGSAQVCITSSQDNW